MLIMRQLSFPTVGASHHTPPAGASRRDLLLSGPPRRVLLQRSPLVCNMSKIRDLLQRSRLCW